MSYKLDPNDVRIIEKDKRVKRVIQRNYDNVIELYTNNITMYLRDSFNRTRTDAYDAKCNLGEVVVEIDLNSSGEKFGVPFRLLNPHPKHNGHYGNVIDHPMYGERHKDISTWACFGSFDTEFQKAFQKKDIIAVTTLLLESMQFVFNHDSLLWDWESV